MNTVRLTIQTVCSCMMLMMSSGCPSFRVTPDPALRRQRIDQSTRSDQEEANSTRSAAATSELVTLRRALTRFFDVTGRPDSTLDAARTMLYEDLDGKDVAILFGLVPSSVSNEVALSFPKSIAGIHEEEFAMFSSPITFKVSKGSVLNASKRDLLLTGKAVVHWPGKGAKPKNSAYRLLVARKDSSTTRAVVVNIDVIDATWCDASREGASKQAEIKGRSYTPPHRVLSTRAPAYTASPTWTPTPPPAYTPPPTYNSPTFIPVAPPAYTPPMLR